jgi:hypothetical protein
MQASGLEPGPQGEQALPFFIVRFAPRAAMRIYRVRGFPHYDLSPAEKKDMLRKLLDCDHSRLIQRGVVKQRTHFTPLASSYFQHMWSVRAGEVFVEMVFIAQGKIQIF